MHQDCSAYAEETLRTVGLLEDAHQYSLHDLSGSRQQALPSPQHSEREYQFNNLPIAGVALEVRVGLAGPPPGRLCASLPDIIGNGKHWALKRSGPAPYML